MTTPKSPSLDERPTAVTAIAVIGIVFGVLGVGCTPIGALPYFTRFGHPNPVVDIVKESPLLYAWMLASLAFGFLLAVVLLVGSIGALGLKAWARTTLMGYAIVALVTGVLNTLINMAVVIPRLSQGLAGTPALVGVVVGSLCGIGFTIALQAAILIVLTRPHVKRAFGV